MVGHRRRHKRTEGFVFDSPSPIPEAIPDPPGNQAVKRGATIEETEYLLGLIEQAYYDHAYMKAPPLPKAVTQQFQELRDKLKTETPVPQIEEQPIEELEAQKAALELEIEVKREIQREDVEIRVEEEKVKEDKQRAKRGLKEVNEREKRLKTMRDGMRSRALESVAGKRRRGVGDDDADGEGEVVEREVKREKREEEEE